MKLPLPARVLIFGVAAIGAALLGRAVYALATTTGIGWHQDLLAAVVGTLALLSWLRPLFIYHENETQAVQFDEGLIIFLLIAVDAELTVVVFVTATLISQVASRRNPVKSAFNFGMMAVAAQSAASVFGLVAGAGSAFSWRSVGAAVVAAGVFFLVNNLLLASVLSTTGTQWREAVFDGLGIRALLSFGSVGVAVGAAFLEIAYPLALPIALLPLFILRHALSGFFAARHDRFRLEGLFRATLETNSAMGVPAQSVEEGLLEHARRLLRSEVARLASVHEDPSELIAPLQLLGETRWLAVSGRRGTEPFDSADQSLLDALAAVGSTALSNAALFQQSQRQRQRLEAITASLGEGVVAVSTTGRVTFANPAAVQLLAWEGVPGVEDEQLLTDPDSGEPAPEFLVVLAERAIVRGETISAYDVRFDRNDGGSIDVACTAAPVVEGGEAVGAVLVFRDIGEQKQLMAELTHQALHDSLTGLPNRRQFLVDLSDALDRAHRLGERHAVLFADIDRFKIINDSLGHHAGDLLLVAIADRIKAVLPPWGRLARFGGDEYTILLEGVASVDDATQVAEDILANLREPILMPDGHDLVAALSIGVALSTPGATRDDVLHDADVAMYEAKVSGRSGRYQVFDSDAMGHRSAERIELEVALRQAIERDELEVHYQPIVSVADGRLRSAEGLVRWNHPKRGLLMPGQFISIAEETGLILDVGKAVLEKACAAARDWRERLGVAISVGVNLSARQFQHPDLLAEIEQVLEATGVDPAQLSFEITESLAMYHVDRTVEVLRNLKSLGASVAIDDFGTGHSALGYLARFPIDVVKIDRSFVSGVESDPVKSAIVSAVLTMATAIGCTTVVEGIETRSELEHLRGLGCTVAQGYYFARPMSPQRLEDEFLVRPEPEPEPVGRELEPARTRLRRIV